MEINQEDIEMPVKFDDERKGYNKKQVDAYVSATKSQITSMSTEIASLKSELESCRKKLEAVTEEYNEIKGNKEQISLALIDAQNRAAEIMENAKKEAEDEKNRLVAEADEKRDLIVERNKMLREMRLEVVALFDQMKQNMNFSFDGIIKTIDGDIEKFSSDISAVNDKYTQE